jgi:hypothetical protein
MNLVHLVLCTLVLLVFKMHHMGISASFQPHPQDLLLSGQNPYDLLGTVSPKNHAHSRLPFRK